MLQIFRFTAFAKLSFSEDGKCLVTDFVKNQLFLDFSMQIMTLDLGFDEGIWTLVINTTPWHHHNQFRKKIDILKNSCSEKFQNTFTRTPLSYCYLYVTELWP